MRGDPVKNRHRPRFENYINSKRSRHAKSDAEAGPHETFVMVVFAFTRGGSSSLIVDLSGAAWAQRTNPDADTMRQLRAGFDGGQRTVAKHDGIQQRRQTLAQQLEFAGVVAQDPLIDTIAPVDQAALPPRHLYAQGFGDHAVVFGNGRPGAAAHEP